MQSINELTKLNNYFDFCNRINEPNGEGQTQECSATGLKQAANMARIMYWFQRQRMKLFRTERPTCPLGFFSRNP